MLRIVEEAARTDTGRQRHANEDSYHARSPVYVVADGMGGAQAGEVASRIAADAFDEDMGDGSPEEQLAERAREANRRIFDRARSDASVSGMGTTLTGALLAGDEVSIVHVGDSRAYLFREDELQQLTRDHSLVEELRRRGQLTSEDHLQGDRSTGCRLPRFVHDAHAAAADLAVEAVGAEAGAGGEGDHVRR